MNLAAKWVSHLSISPAYILELTDRGLRRVGAVELDHTRATRAAVGLVLDLRPIHLADGREQVHQVLVAGGPGQLSSGQHTVPPFYPTAPSLTFRT